MKVLLSALVLVGTLNLNSLPPRPIPPVEYSQGTTTVVQFVDSNEEMQAICEQIAGKIPDKFFVGCAIRLKKNGTPVIFVHNPCNYPEDLYARHVCHEMGHINGWPNTHPNPR